MSRTNFRQTFQDPVTTTYATSDAAIQADQLVQGMVRYQDDGTTNGLKKFLFLKASVAFLVNQSASFDFATDANCQTVKPSVVAGANIAGVTVGAVTINFFAWFQTGGIVSVLTNAGISAGDPVKSTTTAGSLGQCVETGAGVYQQTPGFATEASVGATATRIYMKM